VKSAAAWKSVGACLAEPQKYDQALIAVCEELVATRGQKESMEAKLQETHRSVVMTAAEGKRRDVELHELRVEMRSKVASLEASRDAMSALEQRVAEAQTAKNRAQHQVWRLKQQLQEEASPGASAKAIGVEVKQQVQQAHHAQQSQQTPWARRKASSSTAASTAEPPPALWPWPPHGQRGGSCSSPSARSLAASSASSALAATLEIASAKDEVASMVDPSTASSSPRHSYIAVPSALCGPMPIAPPTDSARCHLEAHSMQPAMAPPESARLCHAPLVATPAGGATTAPTAPAMVPSTAPSSAFLRRKAAVGVAQRPTSRQAARKQPKAAPASCHRFVWPEDLELSSG